MYVFGSFPVPSLPPFVSPDVSRWSCSTFYLFAQKTNPPQEIFDNDHRVVFQTGSASGRFTFTAADSGDHKICFTPSSTSGSSNWLSALHPQGGIKLTLDLAIGETSQIESDDKGKINDIVQKVKDLNGRLQDIRREQVFQRVCVFCFLRFYRNLWLIQSLQNRNVKLNSATNPKQPTPV